MPNKVFAGLDDADNNVNDELTTLAQFACVVQNIDNSAASQKLSLKVLHDYIPAYLKLLKDLQCVALNYAIGLDY